MATTLMTAPHPGLIVPPEFSLPGASRTVRPLTMACPTCGGDAEWQWAWAPPTGSTVYPSITCPACDMRTV